MFDSVKKLMMVNADTVGKWISEQCTDWLEVSVTKGRTNATVYMTLVGGKIYHIIVCYKAIVAYGYLEENDMNFDDGVMINSVDIRKNHNDEGLLLQASKLVEEQKTFVVVTPKKNGALFFGGYRFDKVGKAEEDIPTFINPRRFDYAILTLNAVIDEKLILA